MNRQILDDLYLILDQMRKDLRLESIEEYKPEMALNDDLEIDSISYAELVVIIERKFAVDVNKQGRAETVGDLITRIGQPT